MAAHADQALGGGFADLLGISAPELADGRASARLTVRDQLTGPGGRGVASGVYAAVAEALCAQATGAAIGSGAETVALTTQTSVLAPVHAGDIEAVATARHRGRTTWVWDVEFRSGDAGLCATTRLTVAIRDQPR